MQFRLVMQFACLDGSPQCEYSELLSKWNQHETELLSVQTWICLNSAKVDAFADIDLLGIKARLDGIKDRCRKGVAVRLQIPLGGGRPRCLPHRESGGQDAQLAF